MGNLTKTQYKALLEECASIIEDIQADSNTEYGSDFDKQLSDTLYILCDKIDEL